MSIRKTLTVIIVVGLASICAVHSRAQAADLSSLDPAQVIGLLDLNREELSSAASAFANGDSTAALAALLEHYRKAYPLPDDKSGLSDSVRQEADDVVNHIFQWGPYEKLSLIHI